jgi:acetyl-CoA carboxylase alpha subunit
MKQLLLIDMIVDEKGQEAQKFTVGQIVNMLTEHLLEHLEAIENIKRKHAQKPSFLSDGAI